MSLSRMPFNILVGKIRALCQVGHVLTAEDCDLIEEACLRVEELSDYAGIPEDEED